MTAARLENVAVHYAQRYLVSAARLADHLEKRLRRDVADEGERAALAAGIPAIVERLRAQGLVNDREAAAAKLRSALRAGYETRTAVARAARGAMVGRETVAEGLDEAFDQTIGEALGEAVGGALPDPGQAGPPRPDDPETAAAQAALALRRARRGPWRAGGEDERTRRRDAGWLQRRGFRLDAIRSAMAFDAFPDETDDAE